MAFIVGFLLAVLSIAALAYPFLRVRRGVKGPPMSESLEELRRTGQSLYDEINQLKLDLDVRNVSQEEYQERVPRLRRHAAAILRKEDQIELRRRQEKASDWEQLDKKLEDQVRRLRLSWRQQDSTSDCAACGQPVSTKKKVCSGCGAEPVKTGAIISRDGES